VEREKTLQNETAVKEIMQNVKEEKVAMLKRQQQLERERAMLGKVMKQIKVRE